MINGERRIKLILLDKRSVSMKSPISNRTYRIEKKDKSEAYIRITFQELEAIMVTHGGRMLYEKYLSIRDKDVLEELGLTDKGNKDKVTILKALNSMNVEDFEKFLNELSPEKYLEMAETAVKEKLENLSKIKLIKMKTEYDILPSILSEDNEFKPEVEETDKHTNEDKDVLEFDFDSLLKGVLKEVAEEMDINVGNSKKATIINKLIEEDKEEAIRIAKEKI